MNVPTDSDKKEPTKKHPYEISEIPEGYKSGWTIFVDGKEVNPVKSVQLINDNINMSVNYGMRPEGYDGFVIRETGGAVTIPWMIDQDGQIFVGLVEEYRPTTGAERTLNAPRGMAISGENHVDTARREFKEETGKDIGSRAVQLTSGVNINSTAYDNSRDENPGVSAYAVNIDTDELEISYEDDGTLFYKFPDAVARNADNKVVEKIYGTKFVPLREALDSKDMFTVFSVGLLMGKILNRGDYIVPQVVQQVPEEARS
jgi:8-oxo-dGTP pyrophosphatase MutT (NUDIX family)